MGSRILVADDSGVCYEEFSNIFVGTEVSVETAETMETAVEMGRTQAPDVVVVYAAMTRAFSLLRMLRRTDDLQALPLVVVGEPDQEDLIAKHRQLPTRADRYLLMPLDGELVKSVIFDLILEQGMPVEADDVADDESPFEVAQDEQIAAEDSFPDPFTRVNRELVDYRQRVAELEQDLRLSVQVSKDVRALQQENLDLKEKIRLVEQNQTTQHNFGELFNRLEAGYKETIEDLERLVQEKDSTIAQLASHGENASDQTRSLTDQLRFEQQRISEMKRPISQALAAFAEMDHLESEMGLDELREAFIESESSEFEASAEFAFDEKTLVVNAEELHRKIQDSGDE